MFDESYRDGYEASEIYCPIPDDEDGNFVYVAEGDLDNVLEEAEVQEALASYQEVQYQLKDQRLGRGYFLGKGNLLPMQRGKTKANAECTSSSSNFEPDVAVVSKWGTGRGSVRPSPRRTTVLFSFGSMRRALRLLSFWIRHIPEQRTQGGSDAVFEADRSGVGAYTER